MALPQLRTEAAVHSTPSRGGSPLESASSALGLVWISKSPWRNPSGCSSSFSAGGSLGMAVAGAVSGLSVTHAPLLDFFLLTFAVGLFSFFMTSLSVSDGGFVLVVADSSSLAERPLNPSSSPALPKYSSAPRGFWCMRWCRTKLCFRVNVRSQV